MEEFDYSRLGDIEYFKENRMEAHSDHKYYPTVKDAWEEGKDFRYSLNGLWKFHYARNLKSTIKGFQNLDYDCRSWDSIRVPSHIQMEGFDVPQYVNCQYPWDGREKIVPGQIPERFNPVGSYVKYFKVPDFMEGRRVFVSFQGAESALAVWLNGHFIGYSEDSFTPSEFELTAHLKPGENKLAVQVFKWTSSSWCEDQDFFRFSGIFRDVYLYTIPDVHIYDLKLETFLTESFDEGTLKVSVTATSEGTVRMKLMDGNKELDSIEDALGLNSAYELHVKKPELWSAENPKLYKLQMEVMDKNGRLCEVILENVGFRRFEIKNSIMYLNGKRIVFKGVNRHDFSSRFGRAVTFEETEQDIITMKRNNINAIRTSHYPNNSWLYSLCDKYGLYVIDENNLESHGFFDLRVRGVIDDTQVVPGDRPEWEKVILDRANSMYQRDKNHPSILIWSCGNESYGGTNILKISKLLKKLDSSRPVHYEGVAHDRRYEETSDIESQMYTPAEEIKAFLKEHRKKPFICCEYCHAMGNSCGAMYKYTELAYKEPLYQGGFIWDYIDQSITWKNRYGQSFQAYGGDFGDRPTDYNFSGNGIVYGEDREPSPKMAEVKYNYQDIFAYVEKDKVKVVNHSLFTNTSKYECIATLAKDGAPIEKALLHTDVEPGEEKEYKLPFEERHAPGEYAVTVSFRLLKDELWAERGYEVAFGQGVYKVEEPQKKKTCPPEIINGAWNLGVRGENFEVLFSYINSGMVSYRYGGVEMLKAIPRPNFWRAPIDNDMGNNMPGRYAQWKIASLYSRCIEEDSYDNLGHINIRPPEIKVLDDSVEIAFTYSMPTTPRSSCVLSYRVYGDGTVNVKLSYDPVKELGDMPEFGVMFKMDADYNRVQWYGLGPEETYWDRHRGCKLGIYETTVEKSMAKYLVPQECGNRYGTRWAKVMDYKGRGLLFKGNLINFSALPYTPHEIENASHPYELPPIHYTVVRISKAQMGVGGDNSWGARTHDEFLIDVSKPIELEFSFKGI